MSWSQIISLKLVSLIAIQLIIENTIQYLRVGSLSVWQPDVHLWKIAHKLSSNYYDLKIDSSIRE